MDPASILGGQQGQQTQLGGKNSSGGSQELVQNFQTFVDLLTTQLQNQSPTNPKDPSKFTQQLVQFSQVEQSLATNEKLDKLITAQKQGQVGSAVNLLGEQVEAKSDKVQLSNGQAKIAYQLDNDVSVSQIQIKNADGDIIDTASGQTSAGRHEFTWDGKAADGTDMPEGVYTVEVEAQSPSNGTVKAETRAVGEVTGFETTDQGAVLKMGGVDVDFEDLRAAG